MKKIVLGLVMLYMALMSCQQKLDIKSNWKEVSAQILVLREGAEYVQMWTDPDKIRTAYNAERATADSIRIADSIAAIEAAVAEAAMEMQMSHDELVKKHREDSINLVKSYEKVQAENGERGALGRLCAMFLMKDSIENWREFLKEDFETVNKECEKYIFELSSEDEIAFGKIYINALIDEYNRLLSIFESGNIVNMDEYEIVEGPSEGDNFKNYKIISKNNLIERYFVNIRKGKEQPIVSLRLVNPNRNYISE